MTAITHAAIGLSILFLSTTCFAQEELPGTEIRLKENPDDPEFLLKQRKLNFPDETDLTFESQHTGFHLSGALFTQNNRLPDPMTVSGFSSSKHIREIPYFLGQAIATPKTRGFNLPVLKVDPVTLDLDLSIPEKEPFFRNRRAIYSSVWAFASLNYLYADLVGVMDQNKLVQYQTGVVEGVKITPKFLTVAAGFMQIPLANVFLPHIIKNEKALRWIQIASGTIMTLVQSGTLFVGKPTPYYVLFSAVEIAATTYISIDAIRWKPNSIKTKKIPSDGK